MEFGSWLDWVTTGDQSTLVDFSELQPLLDIITPPSQVRVNIK